METKSYKINLNRISVYEAMEETGINEQLRDAEKNGTFWMCIAQLQIDGTAKIAFVNHEQALKMQAIMGSEIGKEII